MHDEGEREDDEPPPHKDFDPVIEFPDNDPDYKESERTEMTSQGEKSHYTLHKITNSIIHKNIQVSEKLEEMKQKVKQGLKGVKT